MDIRRRRNGNMSPAEVAVLNTVLARVQAEVCRQRQLRGPQHHPDGTSPSYQSGADVYDMLLQQFTGAHVAARPWIYSLLGQVFKAATKDNDDAALREELVRTCAVCTAWLMDLDSRGAQSSSALDAMEQCDLDEQIEAWSRAHQ